MKTHSHSHSSMDRVGMILSSLCVLHCLLLPAFVLSLPIMARYYLAHPWVHYFLAFAVVPVGLFAFIQGYKKHKRLELLLIGMTGVALVALAPVGVHMLSMSYNEPLLMILGGVLLIWAHWQNRKSCPSC